MFYVLFINMLIILNDSVYIDLLWFWNMIWTSDTFLQTVCNCGIDEYVCVFQNNSPRCEHKCNSTTGISCENNGSCVYDRVSKKAKCL